MREYHNQQVSQFCLEGRFLDFVIEDGYKLKGLVLGTSDGECYVKLAKHLRVAFDWRLPQGTWLQAVGTKKYDVKTGEFKLKAERVMAASSQMGKNLPPYTNTMTPPEKNSSINQAKPESAKTKATILVCQKSDCMKRGGTAVCKALEAALSDRSLQDDVTIKGTGCMKNCKAGPNVIMPDKTRYTRIQAAQVPAIIEKHITNKPDNSGELPIPIANLGLKG